MSEVWRHHEEYREARRNVENQPLEDDLELLDGLFGRDRLSYGATPEEVKREALRQLEIEWRSHRNEQAEFWLDVSKAMRARV